VVTQGISLMEAMTIRSYNAKAKLQEMTKNVGIGTRVTVQTIPKNGGILPGVIFKPVTKDYHGT